MSRVRRVAGLVRNPAAVADRVRLIPHRTRRKVARARRVQPAFTPPDAVPAVPRPEHPRPSFHRPEWRNLNGQWQFEVDHRDDGLGRGLLERELRGRIVVPFAPESEASGVGHTDFMDAVWYRRRVDVPAEWAGRRVLLHFGAVDHEATVWAVDPSGAAHEIARHTGGFTPFTAELTPHVEAGGSVDVVVRARDPRRGPQARGKQTTAHHNWGCFYTRTTGIWQTVWLEAVPVTHLGRPVVTPDLGAARFVVDLPLTGVREGLLVRATLHEGHDPDTLEPTGAVLATADADASLALTPRVVLDVPGAAVRPWSPADPHLYGLVVEVLGADGATLDRATTYGGLRSVTVSGTRVLLNGAPVFQRLVLDQGYWPDTVMTAPTDAALRHDIELGQAAGFVGARLHQKVFEERYLFHADRLGWLCWGEYGDWGARVGEEQLPTAAFVAEWVEAVVRDRSHPAIVGWCPLNETHERLTDRPTVLDDVTRAMFAATKAADPTRPVVDASGWSHRVPETDVWDSHLYEQDPAAFRALVAGGAHGRPYTNVDERKGHEWSVPYRGQPHFVSEFGGIWWSPEEAARRRNERGSWGYGDRVRTEDEWHERFAGLVGALDDDPSTFGYCYTQLTDVFQEKNGIYRFDRTPKLDVERVRQVQERPAAYEG